jgi:hypothetical protein
MPPSSYSASSSHIGASRASDHKASTNRVTHLVACGPKSCNTGFTPRAMTPRSLLTFGRGKSVPRKPGVKSARFTSRSGATETRSSSRAGKSSNPQGMAVLRVQQIFMPYAREAGLPHPVASHSLRHSCAVHALDFLPRVRGQSSRPPLARSTQVYARITSPAREQMLPQLAQSRFVVRWI